MTAGGTTKRLSKLARELNVGTSTIVEFLQKKGYEIESNPNSKVSAEAYELLAQEYSSDISVKQESKELSLRASRARKESISLDDRDEEFDETIQDSDVELLIKDSSGTEDVVEVEEPASKAAKEKPELKVVGKIDLDKVDKKKPAGGSKEDKKKEKAAKEKSTAAADKEEKAPEIETKESEKEVSDVEAIAEEKADPVELSTEKAEPDDKDAESKAEDIKVVGKIDLSGINQKTRPARKSKKEKEEERKSREQIKKGTKKKDDQNEKEIEKDEVLEETIGAEEVEIVGVEDTEEFIETTFQKLSGPTVVGRIDLPKEEVKKTPPSDEEKPKKKKKKRKRIKKDKTRVDVKGKEEGSADSADGKPGGAKKAKSKKRQQKAEISDEEVQKQIKDTLARLTFKGKSKGAKYRREKRDAVQLRTQEELERQELEKGTLKVTEFVTVSELSTLMDVSPTDIISTCMGLGLFVSINQRLDAETIALVADEFGFDVEFVSVDLHDLITEEEDNPEDLQPRPPIVTVMGHVDHGKTKLLDYVRNANVVAGEAGGITQHIGAYNVTLDGGKKITFLDTPGHEAFTAMRARGAQVTDVSVIVVAADDGVKPQTVEAINHAAAAGVPLIFAINKIDKPQANPEKIKEELANMKYMVEDWGGKYQSQEISAKQGIQIEELLEKVLLEAEMLDLKANPNKKAVGTVIESSLDKGRGYVATILVQEGTLKVGDVVLAGGDYGHIKAMFNERNKKITEAGPSTPVLILGLNGAPQAGDKFNVMNTDREAKDIANRREQLIREQGLRTKKHITLDEIGRRIAIGNFQELNVIVKGDVDGSIEALADSLIKLSNEEIQVNIKHKAVGQISESDVMLAAASNAVIIGFQVRPSVGARKLAEKEQIDIRLYSIIYDAINELKDAMEGMLSPDIKEEIVATLEIIEVFKVTKVGTIAGCIVRDGKINRDTKVRVIREGIVAYTGELGSLRRFKDEVKEVVSGLECGLNIDKYNDVKMGDIIEGYKETEIRKKL